MQNRLSRTAIALAVLFGVFLGITAFTFDYAEGLSYLSADPRACVNCHIMNSQYDSWQKASHHTVAACVDCHLPHDLIGKYLTKADNGYHHSKGFTFQDFHEPILIKAKSSRVLQENCVRCHEDLTHELVAGATTDRNAIRCVHCHSSVGHGETAGLGGADRGEKTEREQIDD